MTYFSTELASQPNVWRQTRYLAEEIRSELPSDGAPLLLFGCGTSLYVAQAVARYREQQGAGASDAFPASELPPARPWAKAIAISRSGTTTEVIEAARALPEATPVLAIVGQAGSPVGEVVDSEIALPFADEESVVQTRFATTVLSLLLGAYGWDVAASAARADAYLLEPLPDWAEEIEQFVFLGRGVAAAIANEAALKFREIFSTWTEAYPTMEYRHGPISAINSRSLVWILDDQEGGIDPQIRATGARVIHGEGDPLAELVRIHHFAEGLVELRGINPDQPPHLTRSVVLH
jgi:fructoselysine-6-P-deglycase FrlB-like protein